MADEALTDKDLITRWAQAGEAGRVADLVGPVIAERERAKQHAEWMDRQLAHVLRALALTPGRHSVEQLLRTPYEGRQTPLLASMLAYAQPFEVLCHVLEQAADERHSALGGCLYHELLLRGTDPKVLHKAYRGSMPSGRFYSRDLSWLPRQLTDVERPQYFPHYSYKDNSRGFGVREMAGAVAVGPEARAAGAAYGVRQRDSADSVQELTAAPREGGWLLHEGRVFRADRPIPPEAVPGVLSTLPVDCLEGLGETYDDGGFVHVLEVAPSSLAEVWGVLFHTAADGGVWKRGVQGAHGRLAAWGSVSVLAGLDQHAGFADVESAAEAAAWFRFGASTEWWNHDHDYGIAALSRDGRRLAVLAATDTD